MPVKKPEQAYSPPSSASKTNGAPRTPTAPYTDGHRGLAPISPTMAKSRASASSTRSTFDSANVETPVVGSRFVEEPESLGSTAGLGLRKTVDEQVSPPAKPKGTAKMSSATDSQIKA